MGNWEYLNKTKLFSLNQIIESLINFFIVTTLIEY